MIRSISWRPGLVGLALSSVFLTPGCGEGGRRETGTVVEKDPILEAGEKASMEGMRAAMKKQAPR